MYIFEVKAISVFFISFLITWYCIPLFIRIAHQFKILDIPDGKIKQHKAPTPYLGGLAIYIGFIMSLAIIFPFYNTSFNFLLGVTILLFVGLIDDLIIIKPYQKLFGQIVATGCFFKAGFYLKESFFLGNTWGIPLSMLWILTVINAYNLVDVMDGLATVLAIGAVTAFALIASFGLAKVETVLLLLAILGPLCAFFWYNRPPARIYLGDAGSLFIGGLLSVVPFSIDWSRYSHYGLITPCVILAVPLLEVGMLILIRSYQRIPFYHGSPHHFSIYLQKKGWTKWEILYGVTFCNGLLLLGSLLITFWNISPIYMALLGISFLFGWLVVVFF
jgi:UDP-GlcNAc:undecaprenyl-phosphate/decaprenyl-phosphate GlcNAc-1-phosphate transferase